MVKTHHLLLLNIMSRGITLTEDQAMKMTKALVERYRAKTAQEHAIPMSGDYAR